MFLGNTNYILDSLKGLVPPTLLVLCVEGRPTLDTSQTELSLTDWRFNHLTSHSI